jgi:GntR family transcriptional regulator/MocR family aminotransferase
MENPGYPGARNVFAAAGAKVVPVPVDSEGMIFDARRLAGARMVYLTPGHQFPLGVTMSLSRRLRFLEWARRSEAILFEDDYDSEYRYFGKPVSALQGLDSSGVVLFAGSFSKVLFPSLRLGYVVVPTDLVDRFAASISITSRHASLIDQAILCDFMESGHFGRHLRRMREVYAGRLEALLEEARLKLSGLLEVSGIQAGLQTTGWLTEGVEATMAAEAAAKKGLDLTPLDSYSIGEVAPSGLQIGFAAFDEREIRRAVRKLAMALESTFSQLETQRPI